MLEVGVTASSFSRSPSQARSEYQPRNIHPSFSGGSGSSISSPAAAVTVPMAVPSAVSKRTVTRFVQAAAAKSVMKSTSAAANREAVTASNIFRKTRIQHLLP